MEEITSLINQAKSNIDDLELFVFQNQKAKYCNLKNVTTNMRTQLDTIESFIEAAIDDEEYIQNATSDLEFMTSTCVSLRELYATKDVTLEIKGDGDFSATVNELKESTEIKDETVNMLDTLEEDRIETVMPTADIQTESIMQTLDGFENPQPIIEPLETVEEVATVPEINPATLTADANKITDETNEFEKDLDVDAISAFLNGDQTPVGIRL